MNSHTQTKRGGQGVITSQPELEQQSCGSSWQWQGEVARGTKETTETWGGAVWSEAREGEAARAGTRAAALVGRPRRERRREALRRRGEVLEPGRRGEQQGLVEDEQPENAGQEQVQGRRSRWRRRCTRRWPGELGLPASDYRGGEAAVGS
jgi:hypothetical protein